MQPVRSRPQRRTIYLWDKSDTEGIKGTLSTFRDKFMSEDFHSVEDSNPSRAPSTLSKTNSSLPAVQHLGSPIPGLIPSCIVSQNARYEHTRRQIVLVV
ncbi:hypothetical protein DPMN_110004 [Dreissena polymorpha]|uniref:Uncharacterized protein n=1 Tax=Dreissena polymorpha TaxID=45954 RepID=A0A9D4KBC4_DREPO|nr:hypothetical protein DPMN_110004 [Dreissena polymorpha]